MKKKNTIWFSLLILSLLIASCRPAAPVAPTATKPDSNAVFTAAAVTANAMMTQAAAVTPSPLPATAEETQAPPTETLAPTTAPVTPTETIAQPATSSGSDRAEFVSDVTVPDGTDFKPNETFVKTWELQNAGTTTWTTNYSLVFVEGDKMGGPDSVPVPSEVGPGQTVNISVDLTAPSKAGNYRGYWRMRNASGQLFETSVYVEIDVTGSGTAAATATPGEGSTPGATTTPGGTTTPSSGGATVSNVTLSVDNATFEGDCPHTFTFTGQFKLSKPASVTYKLEAGANDPGFEIKLPDPVNAQLDQGTTTLVYTLDFSASVSGWAKLHITSPEDATSNQANFELKCK